MYALHSYVKNQQMQQQLERNNKLTKGDKNYLSSPFDSRSSNSTDGNTFMSLSSSPLSPASSSSSLSSSANANDSDEQSGRFSKDCDNQNVTIIDDSNTNSTQEMKTETNNDKQLKNAKDPITTTTTPKSTPKTTTQTTTPTTPNHTTPSQNKTDDTKKTLSKTSKAYKNIPSAVQKIMNDALIQ
ncbi:hypothetical protein RFI_11675, partial [Reticulomyxa filosa]